MLQMPDALVIVTALISVVVAMLRYVPRRQHQSEERCRERHAMVKMEVTSAFDGLLHKLEMEIQQLRSQIDLKTQALEQAIHELGKLMKE